ncbi:MAG: PorT family protein [Dysgonamonadaceae bacterium]|jgi:hypothetical protein|nr:PorT family protein [Dysgonamonadaceae bacterium]
MKKILFITAFIVLAFRSFSQDYMLLKDGEKVAITILHVADEYVRYRLFDDRSGKMYAKDTSKISKLIFRDGTVKTYLEEAPPKETQPETTIQANRNTPNRQTGNNNQIRTQVKTQTETPIQNQTQTPIPIQPQPPVQSQPQIQSQKGDFLFLTDGKINPVIVVEITPEVVKYRNLDNPTGPLYSVYKSEVEKIIFQNGQEETFAGAAIRNNNSRPLSNQPVNEYLYPSDIRDSSKRGKPSTRNNGDPEVALPKRPLVQFGVRGGVNFSTFSGLDKALDLINEATGTERTLKNENKTAFHAGFICRINLSQNRFFLQPELLVSLQGDKGKEGEEPRADDLYYLQMPVYLVYKMPVSQGCDILLGAGLYGAYGIYGSGKTFDEEFKRLDYGFSFMGGLQFGKIQLTGAYDLGKNVVKDGTSWEPFSQAIDGIPDLYTRNLKISLGYFF